MKQLIKPKNSGVTHWWQEMETVGPEVLGSSGRETNKAQWETCGLGMGVWQAVLLMREELDTQRAAIFGKR